MRYYGSDISIVINFFLCLIILAIGCWAYVKTKDKEPFHISAAFGLFAISNLISLMGLEKALTLTVILIRFFAYVIVALSLYQIAAQKK